MLIFNNSSNLIFFSSLTFRIALSISSNSIIIIEISNIVLFIPLIISKKIKNSERIITFFIIQSLTSMILIFRMIINLLENNYMLIILLRLIIKIGGAPFQTWIIRIIEGIKFDTIFIILNYYKMSTLKSNFNN